MKHLNDDELTLLYYCEASTKLQAHLNRCKSCLENYRSLANFLDAVREPSIPEPRAGFEQRVWSSVAPGLRVKERRFALPKLWIAAPVFAALLVSAFFAGSYVQRRADAQHGFSVRGRERVLLIALGDHLDRSQIVLAEFMNAPEHSPLTSEEQLAGSLLGENRLLRQTALRAGDGADAAILGELERALLEIAHSSGNANIEAIRQSIASEGLLFKVRVVSANVREKGWKL